MRGPPIVLALILAAFHARAADSVLVFNEVQYHPPAGQSEWIELRSLQGVDVNIGGWRIEGGVDFTFPAGTVMPGGGYIVVAESPAQISGALGPWTGQLDNGGETIRLVNFNGRIMDELTYSDSGDWSVAPDGSGTTLARRAASAAEGPEVWTTSHEIGGTPGGLNFYDGATAMRTVAVAIGATWKYEDSGAVPPVDWKTAGFNDSGWKSGATLITGGGAKLGGGARPSAIPDALLGYWAFDETSGTVAANGVAGQPSGTMTNGAFFVSDTTRGRVAVFDGADDRMEVIDTGTGLPSLTFLPAMTASNDFTWAAWVWSLLGSTVADQSGAVILGNRTDPNGLDTSPREFIKLMPTAMQYHRNGATEALDYPDLATSAWTHMCVVKRGLNLDYYRNGTFVQTRTLSGGLSNALPFYVGGDRRTTGVSAEHFQGRVDDVGLWTRALSTNEVAQLGSQYGAAPPLPTPPEQTTTAVIGPQPRYFRKTFAFNGTPSGATLELWPAADDGAIVYLNGTEVWRNNVPPTSETTDASFTSAAVVISNSALINGTNVLSAEVHQFSGGNNDLLFGAELAITSVPGPAPAPPASFIFSEISAAGDANFRLELRNIGATTMSLGGWQLRASSGQIVALPAQNVAPGDFIVLDVAALGFTPDNGARLFLLNNSSTIADAREVTNRLRGLAADGTWAYPDVATFGAANTFNVSDTIVINEIFYHGPGTSPEQWIELNNKSAADVDVGGWKFSDGVSYTFPTGTMIAAGGFLVVAWDPSSFSALHPGVTALGPWSGSLARGGELIRLRDQNDNVADEVRYSDGGRWSQWADGGGSSLELRDPRADNSKGEAWDASDESSHSTWQNVSYSGPATNAASNDPTTWNEFIFGLLDAGEVLIDDISVKDVTQGNVQLIQNGNFSGGTAAFWRIIGTHAGSIVDDPTAPGNKVLKVVASAETEHMHNHATTTLKNGASYHAIVSTDTYSISFRAKWLRGSNALHTRLYVDRLALKTLLNRPSTGGTPGAANGRFAANIGPTFDALSHSPVVPPALQDATVRAKVADPDGIGSVQLFTSINGAAFTNTAMTASGGGIYAGTVPGQVANTLVQFYIRATDTLGAISFFPAAGASSRAMIPWEDGRAQLTLASGAKPHNLRVIMTGADANEAYKLENMMSNASIPCTVILDEREVYYRAGVALKSSEHGRFAIARVGYNIEFPPDDLFLGTHGGVAIDRSGGVVTGQKEILLKSLSILAGGIHAPQDDIIRLIPAKATGTGFAYDGSGMLGAAILSKTRLKGDYLDNQWDNGGDGMMFKYERIYVLTQTINPATRVVDSVIVPENPKIPQDLTSPPGVAVTNLGANREFYRWHWLVESGRDTDDYTGMMNVANAVGQSAGATFNNLTNQYIDVDEWLRAHVPSVLYGVTDNYMAPTGSGQHNALIYFPPGKKAVIFPWDCDFLSQANPTTTSLTGGGDIAKFIANPVWQRLYYGHMLDILNRSFNTATMTTWATHYSRFGTDDMVGSVSAYLAPRAAFAMDVINGTGGQTAPIPFVAFTRTSASPMMVSTPFATITGDGWINVAEIRLLGSPEPLAVTWTDNNSWTLQLPISAGTNTYTLAAYSNTGVQLGTIAVTVTGTGGIFPADAASLVLSELNYNPPGTADSTEFLELLNITGATLDLSGCHFDEELGEGIAYTFPAGVQMPPGGRLLVVRDRAAFIAMYPAAGPLAPNQFTGALDNSGEEIVLYAASGLEIFRFTYGDELSSTDGGGKSLVRVLSSTNPNPLAYPWRESTQNGGNPGGTDAFAFTGSPSADIDVDGAIALLEYACATNDNDAGSRPAQPQFIFNANGTMSVVYQVVPNADDVITTVESSTDLASWVPVTAPVPTGQKRYFHLRVIER